MIISDLGTSINTHWDMTDRRKIICFRQLHNGFGKLEYWIMIAVFGTAREKEDKDREAEITE